MLVRTTPAVVWAVCVAYACLGVLWSIVVPLLHAPDEVAHTDVLVSSPDWTTLSALEGMTYDDRLIATLPFVGVVRTPRGGVAPRPGWDEGLTREDLGVRGERPTLDELAPAVPFPVFENPQRNRAFGYYLANAAMTRVLNPVGDHEALSWDSRVWRWRLSSILLGLSLPWFTYWTARRVTGEHLLAVTASLLPLAIPQLTHSLGSVNNDVSFFPLAAACTMACAWIATGDRSRRVAVVAGAAAGVAMFTKIFALLLPVAIAAAWLVAHPPRLVAERLALAAGATVVFGGFWPIRQIIRTGTPAPRGFTYPIPDEFTPDVGAWLGEVVRRMTTTFWGHFGIEQFPLPTPIVAIATIVTLVGLGVAVRRRPSPTLVLLLPGLGALLMALVAAWGGYSRSGIPSGLHGRYLFAGVCGASAALLLALPPSPPARRRQVAFGALGLVVVMQVIGLLVAIPNYWAGPSTLDSVRTMLDVAPIEMRWVALTAVAGLAAFAVVTVRIHRSDHATA